MSQPDSEFTMLNKVAYVMHVKRICYARLAIDAFDLEIFHIVRFASLTVCRATRSNLLRRSLWISPFAGEVCFKGSEATVEGNIRLF